MRELNSNLTACSARAQENTDAGNRDRFVSAYKDELCFVVETKQWLEKEKRFGLQPHKAACRNAKAPVRRMPIPIEDIHKVEELCFELDDDIRWIIAAVSDSGMRLAEVIGLTASDVHLDEDKPSIRPEKTRQTWRDRHLNQPLTTAFCRR